MLTVVLPDETEGRLASVARERGMAEDALVRALLDEVLDDLEDSAIAAERLAMRRTPISSAEARRVLGLDG